MANPPFPGYLTPAQIERIAKARAESAFGPYVGRMDAQAQTQQQNILGFTQAYAELLKGAAPQVQGAYHQAAQDTQQASAGFSDGMRDALQGSADSMNATLRQLGAPEGQQIQAGTGAADVLHGMQGYIPSVDLATQGAAFTSAAAMLPATAVGRGQQLGVEAAQKAADQKFDLESKRTAGYQDIVDRLNKDQMDRYALDLQAKALGLKTTNTLQSQAKFLTDMLGTLHVVKNGRVVDTGKPASGSDAFSQETTRGNVVADNTRQAADKRAAAIKARDKAIADAGTGISTDIQSNFLKIKNQDPLAGLVPGHPAYVKKPYKQAREILFNKYWPTVSQYATGAGKSALRSKLYKMIDTSLRSQGIRPGMYRKRSRRPGVGA